MSMEELHIVNALPPVADAYETTTDTDVINMKNADWIMFVVHEGVGTTGTTVITVEECDDATPTNSTAIPFMYQTCTSGDTFSAPTQATAAGFTTTAGSNHIYKIWVSAQELSDGYGYIRLSGDQSADDPVLAGVLAILGGLRYAEDVPPTAIV